MIGSILATLNDGAGLLNKYKWEWLKEMKWFIVSTKICLEIWLDTREIKGVLNVTAEELHEGWAL